MLNTQAIEHAKEIGIQKICFATEDTKENIKKLVETSSLTTCFVVYQDAPLFTSVGCIRDYDCKSCTQQLEKYELTKDGKKYVAVSHNCQLMLFNDKPLCFADEAKEIKADFYRMDFCYKQYSSENVKHIVSEVMKFKDIKECVKANINSQKI